MFKHTHTHTTKNPLSIISPTAGRSNVHEPGLEPYRIKDFKSHRKPLQRNDTDFMGKHNSSCLREGQDLVAYTSHPKHWRGRGRLSLSPATTTTTLPPKKETRVKLYYSHCNFGKRRFIWGHHFKYSHFYHPHPWGDGAADIQVGLPFAVKPRMPRGVFCCCDEKPWPKQLRTGIHWVQELIQRPWRGAGWPHVCSACFLTEQCSHPWPFNTGPHDVVTPQP